jgi:hypothetical protein
MTIIKLIFKKIPKSIKDGLLFFQTKKGMLVLVNDYKNSAAPYPVRPARPYLDFEK